MGLGSRYGPRANIVSMADQTLGRPGRWITLGLYIFIYLATLTAYIAEGGTMVRARLRGGCQLYRTFASEKYLPRP